MGSYEFYGYVHSSSKIHEFMSFVKLFFDLWWRMTGLLKAQKSLLFIYYLTRIPTHAPHGLHIQVQLLLVIINYGHLPLTVVTTVCKVQ